MKILGIDTATKIGSVAVICDDKIVAELSYDSDSSHAEVLLKNVQKILKKAKVTLNDIDGVAVTIGPGSFTGLRIGLATAKGLAISVDKLLVGVSTLKAMEEAGSWKLEAGKKIVSCINAYRNEVYANEEVVAPEELAKQLSKDTVLIGDGAEAYKDIFKGFMIVKPKRTVAAGAALLAVPKFKEGKTDDIANLAPNYIRRSAAEEKAIKS